jgi:hypothetical protein
MLLLLLLLQVKIISRRAFDAQEVTGLQLVQLMHGLARMPKYAPNAGWLLALCERVKPLLQQVSPGALMRLVCIASWLRQQTWIVQVMDMHSVKQLPLNTSVAA